jgi:hypothetical protein
MLVNRTRTIEQRVTYVDHLGYAYCTTCYHEYQPRAARCATPTDAAPCDHCHRNLDQSREYVDVAYVVEAIVCKIF